MNYDTVVSHQGSGFREDVRYRRWHSGGYVWAWNPDGRPRNRNRGSRVQLVSRTFDAFDVFHSINEVRHEWDTIDVVAFDPSDDRVTV